MPSQRVMDLMSGRKPDRLAWLPELNAGFVRKTLRQAGPEGNVASDAIEGAGDDQGGQDYLDLEARCAALIGADHLHRVKSVRVRRSRVSVETDRASGVTFVHTPAGDLRQMQQYDPNSGTVFTREHLIKGPEDFAAYRAMVEDESYEADYGPAEADIARSGLATVDVPATPLMHLLLWVMDVQPTLMGIMDHRDEMVELMAAMHEQNKAYYRVAAAGPGDILRPMEDTSSMLTGPVLYAEHCIAQLNDYAEIVHGGGKQFIVHMCGHLDGMIDLLTEVNLDGIEAITAPPLGDAEVARMRRRMGDIWLIGGVDPSMYATATAESMAEHIGKTLDAMRGDMKFMLGHEEIPVAAKMENVQVVARLIAETATGFYG